MTKLPSASPDAEVVQPVGLSMSGGVILLGILGFIIVVNSPLKVPNLICVFSALAIVGGFILKFKPTWRLKFSIRTMLIVVALISVGLAGIRLWALWNTEIHLRAGVGVENWTKLIGGPIGDPEGISLEELAKRFNYEHKKRSPWGRVLDNSSIDASPYLKGILYETTANYFTFNQRVAELREQVLGSVKRNPDLEFIGYAIMYEVWSVSKDNPRRMTFELKTIEEGNFKKQPTESQQNSNPNQAMQWQR